MSDSEIDLVESVFLETEASIAAVTPDQLRLPTPCADYNVADLINHLVGWAQNFASRFSGVSDPMNPKDYRVGASPEVEFDQAAQVIVDAYRSGAEPTTQLPTGFMVMEFLTHGWDLAIAINRPADYSADAAELGLNTAKEMLKPERRGSAFAPAFEVAPDAGAVDRLVAFMGRDPHWRSTGEAERST